MPLSEAPLSALQLPALPFLVILVEPADLRGFWDHSIVLPCPWVSFHAHLLCPCSRPQVVSCAWPYILQDRLRPLTEDSLRVLWLPAHLLWPALRPRVWKSSNLSPWFFPFRGPSPISRLLLGLGPSRSHSPIPSLAPFWWSPCRILQWALLTLYGCNLGVPSAFSLHRSRLSIPFAI